MMSVWQNGRWVDVPVSERAPSEAQNERFDELVAQLGQDVVGRVLGLGYRAGYESIVARFDSFPPRGAERVLRMLESIPR